MDGKQKQAMDPAWVNFCRQRGFKPFPIEQDIDLSTGLIESLMHALANNAYERSVPLIISKSQDPNIDGKVINGRHRIVAAYRLAKKRIAFRFPRMEREVISDVATLNCKIAEAVKKNRRKEPALAKRIVERRFKDVIESKIDQYRDKLPVQIVKMGFSSVTIVNKLLDEVKEKRQKKRPGQKQLKASNPALQYDFGHGACL
jgi:hypothetical protein